MRRVSAVAPVGSAFLITVWLFLSMTGTVPYSDDYEVILESTNGWTSVFQVEFGWFFPIQKGVYWVLASAWGFDSFVPLRILALTIVFSAGALFGLRFQKESPLVPFLATSWLLTIPGAFHTYLWPAATWTLLGIIVLLAIEDLGDTRPRNSTTDWVCISANTFLLLACGPMGIPFAIAIVTYRWIPKSPARTFFSLVPIILYAIGSVLLGGSSSPTGTTPILRNVLSAGTYIKDGIFASAVAIGDSHELAPVFLVAVLLVSMISKNCLSKRKRHFHFSITIGMFSYLGILAITRGHLGEANAPRYTIVGAFVLLTILLDGVVALVREKSRLTNFRLLFIPCVVIVASNVWVLEQRTNDFQYLSRMWRARFLVVEALSDRLPSDFQIDPVNLPQFDLRAYLNGKTSVGSLAMTMEELADSNRETVGTASTILAQYTQWDGSEIDATNRNCSPLRKYGSLPVPTYFVVSNSSDTDTSVSVSWLGGEALWNLEVPSSTSMVYEWSGPSNLFFAFQVTSSAVDLCVSNIE